MCAEYSQLRVKIHTTELPAELEMLHPSTLPAPDFVCSALIKKRDQLQTSILEQMCFLSSSEEFLNTSHDSVS